MSSTNFDRIVREIDEVKLTPLDKHAWENQYAQFRKLMISLVEAAVEAVAIDCGSAPRGMGFFIDPNRKLSPLPHGGEVEAWRALFHALENVNERMRKLGLNEWTPMSFRRFQKSVDLLIAGTLTIGARPAPGATKPLRLKRYA
jgi:hypothetical protein